MAINKVNFGGQTLIDISQDTVNKDTLLAGATAHDANGDPVVGELTAVRTVNDVSPDENGNVNTIAGVLKHWTSADLL